MKVKYRSLDIVENKHFFTCHEIVSADYIDDSLADGTSRDKTYERSNGDFTIGDE